MTPVALWTGRLPGLRRLPRARTLVLVGLLAATGTAGSFGAFGPNGQWFGLATALVALWTFGRHRWPKELPLRLRPSEKPRGPDERAVRVEFRHEEALLGWDVGIIWFEAGGAGFVGRTVSFVLPRGMMRNEPALATLKSTIRAPQMTLKVFESTVGIVPLDRELGAHTTLARLDALPSDAPISETILPPSSMHPDLLARAIAVRRRMPALILVAVLALVGLWMPPAFGIPPPSPVLGLVRAFLLLFVVVSQMFSLPPLPSSIRARLPKEPHRRGSL